VAVLLVTSLEAAVPLNNTFPFPFPFHPTLPAPTVGARQILLDIARHVNEYYTRLML
jgi:hypothetical protein